MIRVGAIGCGEHATTAIWPLFGPAGLQCVAAWSRSQERVEAAAARFGIQRAYTDLGRMFDECELDAVVVIVPPEGFAPVIHAALERRLARVRREAGCRERGRGEVDRRRGRRQPESSRWWRT